VISQFQLLWAVFQSHSTAEDEMIWPALKDKAASRESAIAAAAAAAAAVAAAGGTVPQNGESPAAGVTQNGVTDSATAAAAAAVGSVQAGGMSMVLNEHEYTEEHSQENALFQVIAIAILYYTVLSYTTRSATLYTLLYTELCCLSVIVLK
jgi:flagellar hook-length control protein FliK